MATAESWPQQISETIASTEHQFDQMHHRFEEAEHIWREEFTALADHLNEQQRVLPYTWLYKLFTSSTFGEFMNACVKAQIKGAVTEALEMIKEDFPEVDVLQAKYGYSAGENDRVDRDLAWIIMNPPRFPMVDALIYHDSLIFPWELL